jgi:hypothetical protein
MNDNDSMRAHDVRSNAAVRHGAYVCVNVSPDTRHVAATAAVSALADRLGFRNEFQPGDGPSSNTMAFLRRVSATPREIADARLLNADAIVHAAAETADDVTEFCAGISRILGPKITTLVIGGVVRPPTYTGNAMHNFAYAHRVLQQPGPIMPNGFLIPLSKTAAWWQKDWMERHTYFLPRYDDSGHMVSEGHALASAAGIECIMRRTYWHPAEPAPAGTYDFVSYFECSDADVPTFNDVCAALRDVKRNPEWAFVLEGPTWHGRRVATWEELFA